MHVRFWELGNREVTPDALGPQVVDHLFVTRHLLQEFGHYLMELENGCSVSGIVPGVMAQTGMETAEILNESLRVPRVIRTGLREISFGDLEGLSDEVIAERYELFLRERAKMDRDLSYPGGECAADVVRRAEPVMEEILERPYEAVAVVTHGGVIRSLTAHYLGMDLAKTQLLAGHLENCGITEFVFRGFDGRFFLNRFNDYAHLEAYPKLLRKGWSGKR